MSGGDGQAGGARGAGAFIWGCVLGTLALGLVLRWHLAGAALPWGTFPHLRHAHSHLGYFGILFPLMWAAWASLGAHPPGPRWRLAYALGVVAATFGFARAGYGPEAIAGSTVVGAAWVASALANRRRALAPRDWLASAPASILLASACIPPIAVFTRRDPALATQFVQTFLTLLLFGAILPAAAARIRLPAPPSALWLGGVVASALSLGVLPRPALHLGSLALGAILLVLALGGGAGASPSAPRGSLAALRRALGLPLDLAALWASLGAGLLAVGSGLVPNTHGVAMAGLHLAILGPALTSFGLAAAPRPVPSALRAWHAGWVLLMCGAIGATGILPWGILPHISAAAGTAVAAGIVVAGAVGWLGVRSPARAAPRA